MPSTGEMENADMESEGGVVLLKVRSRRFEMRSVEPSGCQALEGFARMLWEVTGNREAKGGLRQSSGNVPKL